MSKMMWNQVENLYRGQATRGTVVTVDEEAMKKALVNAGNTVFDTDWWVETMQSVLEHWGLLSKRWTDPATRMPCVHYRLAFDHTDPADHRGAGAGTTPPVAAPDPPATATGPLKATGPLSARLNSGKLTTGNLAQDDEGRKTKDER